MSREFKITKYETRPGKFIWEVHRSRPTYGWWPFRGRVWMFHHKFQSEAEAVAYVQDEANYPAIREVKHYDETGKEVYEGWV